MKFQSAYSEKKTFHNKSGSKFMRTFAMELDENGHKVLKETGKRNVYDMIQSHAEECDINNIVARVKAGDKEALARVEGKYIDATDLPQDLAEAQNKIIQVKNEFYTLPLNIREKFNHSPEEYVQNYGTENWIKLMGFTKPEEKKELIEEGAKDNEQGN